MEAVTWLEKTQVGKASKTSGREDATPPPLSCFFKHRALTLCSSHAPLYLCPRPIHWEVPARRSRCLMEAASRTIWSCGCRRKKGRDVKPYVTISHLKEKKKNEPWLHNICSCSEGNVKTKTSPFFNNRKS